MSNGSRRIYRTLDALRGVAAISVACYHYAPYLTGGMPVGSSYLAVDMFFALSGFVIAYAYDDRLARGLPMLAFLRFRLVRLYPVYLAGTSLGLVFVLVRNVLEPAHAATTTDLSTSFIEALLFIPDMVSRPFLVGTFPYDQACWSLSFELAVNLVFALAHRMLRTPVVVGIAVASFAVLCVDAVATQSLDLGMTAATVGGGGARVPASRSSWGFSSSAPATPPPATARPGAR